MSNLPRFTDTARRCFKTIEQLLQTQRTTLREVGAFYGWGGIIYALTHVSILWDDETILEQAIEYAHHIYQRKLHWADEHLDVFSGVAGLIPVLLQLHTIKPTPFLLELAQECGEHLITTAHTYPHGIGWHTHLSRTKAWTGFSHGVAGCAWALLLLGQATGLRNYCDAGFAAITYERSTLRSVEQIWPDLRESDTGNSTFTGWCNGATGIGFSRALTLQQLDPHALEEIRIAAHHTLEYGFGNNHSLCHGDLGNLLMLKTLNAIAQLNLTEVCHKLQASILTRMLEHGCQSGSPIDAPLLGLMAGLSGIGYGLLRLADEQQVPDVLQLAKPWQFSTHSVIL